MSYGDWTSIGFVATMALSLIHITFAQATKDFRFHLGVAGFYLIVGAVLAIPLLTGWV